MSISDSMAHALAESIAHHCLARVPVSLGFLSLAFFSIFSGASGVLPKGPLDNCPVP